MKTIKLISMALAVAFAIPGYSQDESSLQCERALRASPVVQASFALDPLREKISTAIERALRARGVDLSQAAVADLLALPPKPEMGQVAFPCFQLAKILKTAPVKIAEAMAAELSAQQIPLVVKVEAAGPYVNFHADYVSYLNELRTEVEEGRFFTATSTAEKISLEFSQPNTHKALHVGHMRNMFLGESVARLLEYAGHKVIRSTYPGDMGTHVAKVLWYVRTHKHSEIPSSPSPDWLGRMYSEADQFIKAHAEDASVKEGITGMLKQIESGEGDDHRFYCDTREWSLAQMRGVYDWLGIRFDNWYYESECDLPSRQLVLEKKRQGLLVESDGALGLDLKGESLGFVIMLKSDGSGLYLTKDLELIRRKFAQGDVTRSIVVVDARQKLHFQQLFRSAEILGFPNAGKSIHLSYETVTDRDGSPLSSRALNGGLGLTGLKAEIEARENSKQALQNLRWGFLRVAPSDQIRFDMEDWLSRNGNSAGEVMELISHLEQNSGSATSQDLTPTEKVIVTQIAAFNIRVVKAVSNLDPSEISRYISELKGLLETWKAEGSSGHADIGRMAAAVLKQALRILTID